MGQDAEYKMEEASVTPSNMIWTSARCAGWLEFMDKFYCYVDESGQDTDGAYFIVVVVMLDQHIRNQLEKTLEDVEHNTGKGKRKWGPTRPEGKVNYLTRILHIPQLKRAIFYMSFSNTKEYTELTILTLAQAILERITEDYSVRILIDGLNAKERSRVSKGLHRRGIQRRKLIGGRDESNALLRLADAMAGFLRDFDEGKPYTPELYRRLSETQIITKIGA